ncbi:hypothetical protein DDE05_01425, partial [Streptomyces cavourensis]
AHTMKRACASSPVRAAKDVDKISRGGNPPSEEDDCPECDDEAQQRPQGIGGDPEGDRSSHSSDDPGSEAENRRYSP